MTEHKAVWTARKIKDDVNMSWRKEFIEREKGVLKEEIITAINSFACNNCIDFHKQARAKVDCLNCALYQIKKLGLEEVRE